MTTTIATAASGQLSEKEYKRRIRAWTMYDWANSAFVTTVMAAVLPVYYSQVAGATLPSEAAATAVWSMGLSISLFVVAIFSPILGTVSDVMRGKKKFLAVFVGMGVVATGLLVLVSTGDWILASFLFILGRIGMTSANVFYDALLPHVALEEDQDSVSTRGYAMGYLGGGILLAVNIGMIFMIPDFFENAGTRLSLLSVAIWWAVFSIPMFTRIPEPPAASSVLTEGQRVVSASFRQIRTTFKDIQRYKELFKFLIAFLIYNDGIGTIIGVATIYGAELGFGTIELILALLLVQFVGIPFSLIFGRIPNKETKYRSQFLAFVVFNVIALPLAGVIGFHTLPKDISGAPPAPYESTDTEFGEGVYSVPFDARVNFDGAWAEEVIPAEDLTGGDFIDFVNRLFGDPLTDVTYATTTAADAAYTVNFNGQEVELTYSTGPEHGIWAVEVDGAVHRDADGEVVTIDAHSATTRYGARQTIMVAEPGTHSLTLVNTIEGGGVMSVAQVEIADPIRQNNLGLIMGMVLGLQLLGVLFAWALGKALFSGLADLLDTKRSVILALAVYSVIAVWAFFLDSTIEFWFLAWMVAIVQGGSQALSRSLYAGMSPASRSGEFFGLFGVMEKFSAILGPILFALAGTLLGNSRPAILSLIAFFFVGTYLLLRVDVDEGRRVAQAEDAQMLDAAAGD